MAFSRTYFTMERIFNLIKFALDPKGFQSGMRFSNVLFQIWSSTTGKLSQQLTENHSHIIEKGNGKKYFLQNLEQYDCCSTLNFIKEPNMNTLN